VVAEVEQERLALMAYHREMAELVWHLRLVAQVVITLVAVVLALEVMKHRVLVVLAVAELVALTVIAPE
jgi:hypothetical protein